MEDVLVGGGHALSKPCCTPHAVVALSTSGKSDARRVAGLAVLFLLEPASWSASVAIITGGFYMPVLKNVLIAQSFAVTELGTRLAISQMGGKANLRIRARLLCT